MSSMLREGSHSFRFSLVHPLVMIFLILIIIIDCGNIIIRLFKIIKYITFGMGSGGDSGSSQLSLGMFLGGLYRLP